MLLYAVQVEVDEDIAEAWRKWMNYTHIAEVIATGRFRGYRFGEVVEPPPLAGKRRFLVLYEAPDEAHLESYLQEEAPRLRAVYPPEFQGRFTVERWVWKMS